MGRIIDITPSAKDIRPILMILTFLVTPVVMGYQVLSRGLSVTGALAAAGRGATACRLRRGWPGVHRTWCSSGA